MTNDPDTKHKETPDQTSRQERGGSSTAGGQPKSPTSSFPVGDPARRDFGDRTDDESKRKNPIDRADKGDDAESGRTDDSSNDDAGEGHKGPRAEAKGGPSGDRTQSDRSNPGQQRQDKSKPMQGEGKSGDHGGGSTKNPDGNSGRNQGGGAGR